MIVARRLKVAPTLDHRAGVSPADYAEDLFLRTANAGLREIVRRTRVSSLPFLRHVLYYYYPFIVSPLILQAERIMSKRQITPTYIAAHIRRVLKDGGSAPHSKEVQWFFKEEIKSRGWYTAELRKVAVRFRRSIERERGMEFVVQVADRLFSGRVLEEKVLAVFLLEGQTEQFGKREFGLFASWIDRISSWADHDALAHDVLAPMLSADPTLCRQVFVWAKSRNRWRRRAACVALIRGARKKQFFPEIKQLTEMLLLDEDDMVQKGLGWLLRETAKYDAERTLSYLMKIRKRAPRLVLRTACETLPAATRERILA